jgi:hypothetical protein
LAYERRKGDNTVLVVLNFSDKAVDVTVSGITAGAYTRVLDSETVSSGFPTSNTALSNSSSLHLGAKGYQVYSNGNDFETHHLYVDNRTSWNQFDLYGWGDCEFFGSWPGATYAPTVTVNAKTWRNYEYTVTKGQTELEMHLIFHNNIGEYNPNDRRRLVDLTKVGDYFLTITDTGYEIVTALGEIENNSSSLHGGDRGRLILHNCQFFILRGEKVYTVTGQEVK